MATGLLAATAFGTLAIPPSEGRWTTVNGFDGSARDALRIRSDRQREMARDASDLLLTLMTNHLAVDALLVTWWGHGRGSVAWEIAMIDVEALALNAALNGVIAGLTSRERPYRAGCAGPEEQQDLDCRGSKRYRSFFSGHSSTAFTAGGARVLAPREPAPVRRRRPRRARVRRVARDGGGRGDAPGRLRPALRDRRAHGRGGRRR